MKKRKESEKEKRDGKRELLFIVIILAIGFLLRLFLTNCYYWDELVYLQHSEILSGKVDNYNEFAFRPLLFSILISGLYLIWHNPLMANLLVSFLSTLTILFVYLAAKEMFNKKIAIIAALLFTFWPIHIYFSKTLLVHTIAMFFASVFLFFLKRAENNGKILMFFLAGTFAGLAILTRFTYLALIPIIIVNLLLFKDRYNLKKLFFGFVGLLILVLPYLMWAYKTYGNPLYTFKMASLITSWSTQQPWHFYFTNLWPFLGLSGIFGIFFWLLFKIKDKKISREEIFLIAWLLLPLTYLSFMIHKEVRFLLISFVPIIILSAVGFEKFSGKIKNNKIFLLLFFLILAISFFTFSYDPYPRICETDAQKASEWIMKKTDVGDVIYAQHEFTALAYYTNRTIILAPFNKTRFFDKEVAYMNTSGYYVYFEEQATMFDFPTPEEIEQDSRFKLIVKIKNKKEIYIYRYTPSKRNSINSFLYKDMGYIIFSFDDNRDGQIKEALPILKKHNLSATFFVTEDNFKKQEDGFFGESKVRLLYFNGHEIGSHTKSHGNLKKMSIEQLEYELKPDFLYKINITPKGISYPYGEYNKNVIKLVKKYYSYARGLDKGLISLDEIEKFRYTLPVFNVLNNTSIEEVKAIINKAGKEKKVVILVFHNIVKNPKFETEISTDTFEKIVEYVKVKEKNKEIKVIRIIDLFEYSNGVI